MADQNNAKLNVLNYRYDVRSFYFLFVTHTNTCMHALNQVFREIFFVGIEKKICEERVNTSKAVLSYRHIGSVVSLSIVR